MRTNISITAFLGACLSSCTGITQHSPNAVGSASAGPDVDEARIMSQDECDRRAGAGITTTNCDAEFDKLVREIESEKDDSR